MRERVTGLTFQQATFWVKQLMGQQLLRPDLQLRVVKPRPIRVALVGEVERPGIKSLTVSETVRTEGGPSTGISGLQAVVDTIQKAGGITQVAICETSFFNDVCLERIRNTSRPN